MLLNSKVASFLTLILLWSNSLLAASEQYFAEVETVKPEKKQVYNKIHSAGVINSPLSTYLLAESSGKITKIYFADGGQVKAGDVLAQIDDQVARADLDAATANFNLARLKTDRAKKLLQAKAISQVDFDQSIASLAQAEADKAKAQDATTKTRLIAPFDGIIGFAMKQEYDYVSLGDEIFQLEQLNPLQVEFSLPRRFYGQVKLEDIVKYDLQQGRESSGHIIAVNKVINPEDESFNVKAIIANPNNDIIPGVFTSIDILANPHQAILIPQQAIVLIEQGPVVYKLDNQIITITPVKKGQNFGNMVEINSGITDNDDIIISGQMKLYSGMKAHSLSPEEKK